MHPGWPEKSIVREENWMAHCSAKQMNIVAMPRDWLLSCGRYGDINQSRSWFPLRVD